LNIPGYQFVRRDRTGSGGGVGIFIKYPLKCTEISLQSVAQGQGKVESLTLQIQLNKVKSFVVSCVYRPKFSLSTNDLDLLEEYFSELCNLKYSFYSCGDFNIHLEDTSKSHIRKFNSLMTKLDLTELIQKPSRGKARLDLIITNTPSHCLSSYIYPPILTTDHEAVFIVKQM